MSNPPKLFEYVGAIHIHTTDSDGSKPHEDIIKIADRLHLDFLFFSDHMTLKHKSNEGWHKRVLVVVGYEIHDPSNKNHYLAFGIDEVLPDTLIPPEYVREVKKRGALGIIAHPDEVREQKGVPPAYPWTAWDVKDYDGIEVWNHMSDWLEGIDQKNRFKRFFHPRSSLNTPAEATLKRWDEEAERRRIIGIGSLDAHAAEYYWGPVRLTIFPYKVQLQTIRTHVLVENPLPYDDYEGARKELMTAISRAQVFIGNERWGNCRGFRFWAESKRQFALMGGAMRDHRSIVFKVSCPTEGTIRLIKSGEVVAVVEGAEAEFPVQGPGPYRVEVLKNGKGWIYSNHIKILPPREQPYRRSSGERRGKPSSQREESAKAQPQRKQSEQGENRGRPSRRRNTEGGGRPPKNRDNAKKE
jgi:hypothetical protein